MTEIEDVKCVCPGCGNTVIIKLVKNGGVLSDPAYVLVADWIYHSECWDKQVEEFPP